MTKINKVVIFLLFFFISFFYLFHKDVNIKIALCTMGKKENLYVKEYIEYYKRLGFDHIFIYDNNDPNDEKFSDVINEKYKSFVTIYDNINDSIKNQSMAFTQCYRNNKNKYDWILMADMDEYLVIVNDKLKNYLNKEIFKKCDFIKIHWLLVTDNNLLHYDNRSLFERFKPPFIRHPNIKTLVKGKIEDLTYSVHAPINSHKRNITCNNIGRILNFSTFSNFYFSDINIDKAYILHFKFKSTEEFINKYKRGYNNWWGKKFLNNRIHEYFKYNELSLSKIKYMEKELKKNLSKYKLKYFKLKHYSKT